MNRKWKVLPDQHPLERCEHYTMLKSSDALNQISHGRGGDFLSPLCCCLWGSYSFSLPPWIPDHDEEGRIYESNINSWLRPCAWLGLASSVLWSIWICHLYFQLESCILFLPTEKSFLHFITCFSLSRFKSCLLWKFFYTTPAQMDLLIHWTPMVFTIEIFILALNKRGIHTATKNKHVSSVL